MEVKALLDKWIMKLDLNRLWIFLWVAVSGYYFYLLGPKWNEYFLTRVGLSLGTGLLATYTLSSIGFFNGLRVSPRRSDFLLLLFAMAVAFTPMALTHATVFRYSSSLFFRQVISIPMVAVLIFAGYVMITTRVSSIQRRRIVLRLSPEERVHFLEAMEETGFNREADVLTDEQVNEEFAPGLKPRVDLIVFSRAGSKDMEVDRFLFRAHVLGLPIIDRRVALAAMTGRIDVDTIDVWSFFSSATRQTPWIRFNRLIQETIEPVIALVALILLSPILLLVAIAIKLDSPGPILYKQRRTGYLGKVFMLYKFRSMRTDSEVAGIQWAKQGDTRVTEVGKFIRKTRLDELPQLWNVVRSELALVGPRPERPEIYRDLKDQIPLFWLRTDVRPGITGWAQVCAGYAASVEESKLKLQYDFYYIQHMSIRLDIVIMLMTAKVMLFGNEYITLPRRRTRATASTGAQPKLG
ncbi:MAG: sugar transferase [Bdellovibrionales bacterium]|nr:sugar transferase [Bdellovibrionales bacterium]